MNSENVLDYNAIVRDANNVLALTKVTQLSEIPKHCKILYRSELVQRDQPIENILICKTEPLQIFTKTLMNIYVRDVTGSIKSVPVHCTETTRELKKHVESFFSIHPAFQRLVYAGRQLEDHARIFEYGILNESTIFVTLRLRGGGAEDVDNQTQSCMQKFWNGVLQLWQNIFSTKERGLPNQLPQAELDTSTITKNTWQQGGPGLNICGKCSNAGCSSSAEQHIVLPMSFGRIKFGNNHDSFDCPACTKNTFSIQNIQYFVTSFCRTLVYMRSSGLEKVTTKLLECPEPFPNFKVWKCPSDFNDIGNVEMITVCEFSSPFYCNKCHGNISKKHAERQLECGHIYHKICVNDSTCIVCSAQFKSLSELFGSLSDLGIGIDVEDNGVRDFLPENGFCEKWNFEFEACSIMLKMSGLDVYSPLEISEESLGNLVAQNKIEMLLLDKNL